MPNQPEATAGQGKTKGVCSCPFCDGPVEKPYPFCKDCGKTVNYCSQCGKPIPPHQKTCRECRT